MKFFVLASALFASATALACPDFSGKYLLTWEMGQVNMTITQTACESMQMEVEFDFGDGPVSVSQNVALDGIFRQDGATGSSASYFADDAVISDWVSFDATGEQVVMKSSKSKAKQDASGNIVVETESFDASGKRTGAETQIYKRM